MKYSEIKEMTTTELKKVLKEERTQLTRLRFQHAVASLENPNKISLLKKDIARYLTELRKRINENSEVQA